jgi:hypothetical protein
VKGIVVAASIAALAACDEARHEPVRVVAQPRTAATVVSDPPPAVASAAAPAPGAAASIPLATVPRGLDAAPPTGMANAGPPQRRWQPGEPNGNADFRAALESRQRAPGNAVTP